MTSHDQLGSTGRKTGFWLEEFAAPYFVFRDAGIELTLASPKGGQPPIDPKSDLKENQTAAIARFKQDARAQEELSQTVKLETVRSENYDTIFYVDGHGPMWDLGESRVSIALLELFYNSGKVIALVCHSPGVLRHAIDPCRAVSRRRRADAVGSHLREGHQLATACGGGWPASHGPESGIVHARGPGATEIAREAKSFGRLRTAGKRA